MKKFLLILLCVLIISPCAIFLSACGVPNVYEIIVLSSDARYGLVLGGGQFDEGNSVTISAKPKTSDCQFLCWTLNNKIISSSPDYTFTATNETQGNYVAVFDQGCDYFVLSEAVLDVYTDVEVDSLNFQVKVGTTLSSLQLITDTTTSPYTSLQNSSVANFHTGLLIHRKTDNSNPYHCEILANSTHGETTSYYKASLTLDYNSLLENGLLEFKRIDDDNDNRITINGFGKVALKFERLNADFVSKILKVEAK